jgi:hypothetical protein
MVEFNSNGMFYLILRKYLCDIIVMTMQTQLRIKAWYEQQFS